MPRIIGAERNELIINDALAGCQVGLYYRMPTTKERQSYLDAAVKRTNNKISMHQAEARIKHGMAILVGIRDGDFMRLKDGEPVAMSSTPTSPDYYPGWKDEMESGCGDLVMAMAALVIDTIPQVVSKDLEGDAGE